MKYNKEKYSRVYARKYSSKKYSNKYSMVYSRKYSMKFSSRKYLRNYSDVYLGKNSRKCRRKWICNSIILLRSSFTNRNAMLLSKFNRGVVLSRTCSKNGRQDRHPVAAA